MKTVSKLLVILVIVGGLVGGICFLGHTPSDDRAVSVKEAAETTADSLPKSPIEEDSVLKYLVKS